MSDGPTELQQLRMENDLLGHEARVLRARMTEASKRMGGLQEDYDDAVHLRNLAASEATAARDALAATREELATARDDLTRLLKRLGSGAAGMFFRRRSGYQSLAKRWLR